MPVTSAAVLNRIAPRTRHDVWRRLFSLKEAAQAAELDRLRQALLARGLSERVADAYLSKAPIEQELEAIFAYRKAHSDPSWAINEIAGIDLVVGVDIDIYQLTASEDAVVTGLLEADPDSICPPVPPDQQLDAWFDEASSMLMLTAGDWAAADAAEVPGELIDASLEADDDDNFDDVYDEWLQWALGDPLLVMALEQCCVDAVPLPPEQRAVRLQNAPEQVRVLINAFWYQCPAHVAALLASDIYWVARAERGRRRGIAEWTPLYPLPPWWEEQEPNKAIMRWSVEAER